MKDNQFTTHALPRYLQYHVDSMRGLSNAIFGIKPKQIEVFQMSTGYYLPITVNGKRRQTENPRTKDWPEYDPNPAHCTGHGHAKCVKDGIHSSFNHSMDSWYANPNLSNLPPGYREE